MRVITGSARGTKLATIEGEDVRPTADRVKEAVFSSLQFELEGRFVLDLFAGSGQLGIEALSRGASRAFFVEHNPAAVAMVRQNLRHTQFSERASVFESDYAVFLAGRTERFDIAFVDPPYSKGLVEAALPKLVRRMAPDGVIICEAAGKDPLPQTAGQFALQSVKHYGKTAVGIYRLAQATPENR